MKYEIKNCYTGEVICTCDIDCPEDAPASTKLGLAVKEAINKPFFSNGESTCRMSADLRFADLRGADIIGADLSHTDFTGADFTHANFRDTILTGTDFTDVDLTHTNFVNVSFTGVPRLLWSNKSLLTAGAENE